MRPLAALIPAATLALALSPSAWASTQSGDTLPGQAIVSFEGASAAERAAALRESGARVDHWLPDGDTAVVHVMGPEDEAIADLRSDPRVEHAEQNQRVYAMAVPNDPLFGQQWGLQNLITEPAGGGLDIGAVAAWDQVTGADHATIAVVDGGVDATHPDLAPNLTLTNPGETGGGRESNGRDDDGNGLVDDWRGWDWVQRDNQPDDLSLSGHGTRVAGILAARGNDGVGVSGTIWNGRVMSLRVLDARGEGAVSDVISALDYAGRQGIRVVNASLGTRGTPSALLSDVIERYPDTLFVFPSGNAGANNDGGVHTYPCDFVHPNILCVAASNPTGALADFSSYGTTSVDLAAPGTDILSTAPGGGTSSDSGTSFASPFAAGAAALVLSANPDARTAQLRGSLLSGARVLPQLEGWVSGARHLSVEGALRAVPAPGTPPAVLTGGVSAVATRSAILKGQITLGGGPATYRFEYGAGGNLATTTTIESAAASGAIAPVTIGGLLPNTTYQYRLVATDFDGKAAGATRSFTTAPPPPPETHVGAKVRGRLLYLKFSLPTSGRLRAILERRKVVRRNGRRVAVFTPVKAFGWRTYPEGSGSRVLQRFSPGRYRVRVIVMRNGTTTRFNRGARINPRLPRVTGIPVVGGRRRVGVKVDSLARVTLSVARIRGGKPGPLRKLRTVRVARGTSHIAVQRLSPGTYRLHARFVEGDRVTTRQRRFVEPTRR